MKKISTALIVACLLFSLTAQAQEGKTYRHELGFDATALLGRIVTPSVWGFISTEDYQPTYYVYYRYRFDKFRLRTAIGGELLSNDLENTNRVMSNLDYKLGAELFSSIGKRWELYYGLDGVIGNTKQYNEYEIYNEYLYNNNDEMNYWGVAPFLGFRFQATKRLNIAVEMSAVFRQESIVSNQSYMKDLVENPTRDRIEERMNEYKQTNIFYTAPDFLVLNFLL
ncbi:MAG: hypothetical protein ACPG19_08670 [Saprospiraceae bacterium]